MQEGLNPGKHGGLCCLPGASEMRPWALHLSAGFVTPPGRADESWNLGSGGLQQLQEVVGGESGRHVDFFRAPHFRQVGGPTAPLKGECAGVLGLFPPFLPSLFSTRSLPLPLLSRTKALCTQPLPLAAVSEPRPYENHMGERGWKGRGWGGRVGPPLQSASLPSPRGSLQAIGTLCPQLPQLDPMAGMRGA